MKLYTVRTYVIRPILKINKMSETMYVCMYPYSIIQPKYMVSHIICFGMIVGIILSYNIIRGSVTGERMYIYTLCTFFKVRKQI